MAKHKRKKRMIGSKPRSTKYDMTNRSHEDVGHVQTSTYEITSEPIFDHKFDLKLLYPQPKCLSHN